MPPQNRIKALQFYLCYYNEISVEIPSVASGDWWKLGSRIIKFREQRKNFSHNNNDNPLFLIKLELVLQIHELIDYLHCNTHSFLIFALGSMPHIFL